MNLSALTSNDLLSALARVGDAAFLWTTADDRIAWSSDRPAWLTELSVADAATGTAWTTAFETDDARAAWLASPTDDPCISILRAGDPDAPLYIEERLTRVVGVDETAPLYLATLRDVTVERMRLDRLTYLAQFDELTGHFSRAQLRAILARRMAAASRDSTSLRFGLLGLDNLSGFNSMFGYDIADVVLVAMGQAIATCLSPRDALGRIGSSKFAVIFDDCPDDELEDRLREIQTAIRETIIETGAGPVAVTVSAAGLSLPRDAQTTHDAFAAAEDTLNHAKDFGLDQVVLYTPNERASETRRDNIAVADDLVAAVRENRLRLAYQPIVRASDPSQVAFHECLLRLIDRTGKLVNAGAFMPVAEKLGLVRMLDRRVLQLAFETLRENDRVRLSVNISPQSLRDTRWISQFEDLAAANPDSLNRLILEVTEATAIEDAESAATILNRLRDMGCSIALDDFGAGYTSFQQLKDLTIDIVKIDGSYVRTVLESKENQVFIGALVSIAKYYDAFIVAEMVDSDEAGALLQTFGVDSFQGFHFGMPEVEPEWLGREAAERIVQAAAG